MQFTVNGERFDLDLETTRARLRGRSPEPVQVHWVEVDGVRFPVKQALEAVLGISRATFTSQVARSVFERLGLPTSQRAVESGPVTSAGRFRRPAREAVPAEEAGAAFAKLVEFFRAAPLTAGTAELERRLVGRGRETVTEAVAAAGMTEDLLRAALIVRRDVGRVSDLIHAAVITLALPHILDDGEVLSTRPSLGPGNDPTRLFDLHTNQRVAEFKVSVWSGGDMARKRTLVADLVGLALDAPAGLRPELWVAGQEPLDFLKGSTSLMTTLLGRSSQRLRSRYEAHYADMPLRDFVSQHASRVVVRDLAKVLPTLAAML